MGDVWYMIQPDKTRGKPNRASGSEAIRRSFTHQCEAPTGTGEEWAVEEMEPANM